MDDINSTLDRLLQADMATTAAAPGEIRHGFSLSGHHFLLQPGTYCELAAKQSICALPDCPDWFAGFINHRGHAVPVYDLVRYLDTNTPRAGQKREFWILLLDAHPNTAGFMIPTLPTVLTDLSSVEHINATDQPANLSSFISQAWQQNGQRWYEIDHTALLNHLKLQFQPSKQQ